MILALILILAISFGGACLTYAFAKDEPALWRFAVGTVVGTAIFGTANFIAASFFGLNIYVVIASLLITLLPVLVMRSAEPRKAYRRDRDRIKGNFQGKSYKKLFRFSYYLFFVLLFVFFFERAMFQTEQGIFTGGSNNLGDLPFHLGAIFSFTDAANFPPINPSYSGAKFSYPFIADLVTAAFMKLGIGVKDAMLVTNVFWAFSLLVITERFVLKIAGDKLAARLASFLLFFSGGLGFIWFFGDYSAQSKGFFEFLNSLPKDYTIGDNFRWGNSMITLFLTQRSLLLGMPITLAVMTLLWNCFSGPKDQKNEERHFLIIGLIAGLLPLIHLHSLFVLFILTGFLFVFRHDLWRTWIAFGIGVCVAAIPELIWSITGSATHAAKFFAFNFGWDSGDQNIFWFWLKNTGFVIPLLIAGIAAVLIAQKGKSETERRESDLKLYFYIPFVLIFVLANIFKFAPWEWDNIKLLIYWFAGSLPFICLILAMLWRKAWPLKVLAAACFAVLIFSGGLDVWRTASGQVNALVFDADSVEFGKQINLRTAPNAIVLNAPTYNSSAVLSGRISVMRYPGHLGSHGIDYAGRGRDVTAIYLGSPNAVELMAKYNIDYVIVSPQERTLPGFNEAFFRQFPVRAKVGDHILYKVR